jgi:putative restriction endonuclease
VNKNNNLKYFIFDSGKKEGDIDFERYAWDLSNFGKVRSGDKFLYKCSQRVSNSGKFFFFGSGVVGPIHKIRDRKVYCEIQEPVRFTNNIYQDDLEGYDWVFKVKGKDYQRFFNQYGMTEIVFKDFKHIHDLGTGKDFDEIPNEELVESHKRFYSNEDHSSEDQYSLQKNRGPDQKIFSDQIKDNYKNKCCITGITSRFLLEGSHIVPWTEDKSIRTDPRNGLCLSKLVHKCFDEGLIVVDDNYLIRVSKKINNDEKLNNYLKQFDKKRIELPAHKENHPKKEYLKRHRDKFK